MSVSTLQQSQLDAVKEKLKDLTNDSILLSTKREQHLEELSTLITDIVFEKGILSQGTWEVEHIIGYDICLVAEGDWVELKDICSTFYTHSNGNVYFSDIDEVIVSGTNYLYLKIKIARLAEIMNRYQLKINKDSFNYILTKSRDELATLESINELIG